MFYSYVHGRISDKLQKRYWFWMYPIPIVVVGCFIFMFTSGFGAPYFSMFLLNFAYCMNGTVSYPRSIRLKQRLKSAQIYAWIASSIPRPPAKRAAAIAFMNSIGNAASIWTPFTYTDSSAPRYRPALGVVIGLMCLAGISGTGLRYYLQRENTQLERSDDIDAELNERDVKKLQQTAELEGVDVATARQLQKGFRYII